MKSFSILIGLLMLCTATMAFQLDGPGVIPITDANGQVTIFIKNADLNKGYSAQFFGPGNQTVETLSNNVKIQLFNNTSLYNSTYTALLRVKVKNEVVEKKILIQYFEPKKVNPIPPINNDTNKPVIIDQNKPTNTTDFNSLLPFGILFNQTPLDTTAAINVLLIIIAVILIVAFAARVYHRLGETK